MNTAPNSGPEQPDNATLAFGPRKSPPLRVVKGTDPTSKLDLALYFLSKGFPIVPLRPDEKHPFTEDGGGKPARATPGHPLNGGALKATRKAETVKRWFRDYPDINYGLRLDGRTCVDVDTNKGPHWQMELSCVAGLVDPLPDTLANVTARDGLHIFFEGETEHKNKKFASGLDYSEYHVGAHIDPRKVSCVDIKAGATQYVVGPGCTFEGRPYRLERNLPIAPLPEFCLHRV